MTAAMTEDRVLTPQEAADYLRISRRHLLDLTREGKIDHVPMGRLKRYRSETLRQWVIDRERRG